MRHSEQMFDLIIVGGGPAGAVAALYARRHGLTSLLLDKEKFPRDKACGDGLTPACCDILRDLNIEAEFDKLPGIRYRKFVVANSRHIEAEIGMEGAARPEHRTGYVIRRELFDNFLFEKAKAAASRFHENFQVDDIVVESGTVKGVTGHHKPTGKRATFHGKIVLAADGAHSVVARRLGFYKADLPHSSFAVRQYYRNVEGLNDGIEVHFLDDVKPGYLWIFPLDDGLANVGIGMRASDMKNKKINLVNVFESVKKSPAFAARFAAAEPVGKVKGADLPLGSIHRRCHGPGYLLAGDAAGLVDPFSGEGIANAMKSARIAVETAATAVKENDFSSESLARYDKRVWSELGPELGVGRKMQKILQIGPLQDLVLRKAKKNPSVREALRAMFVGDVSRRALAGPMFYLKLLFK